MNETSRDHDLEALRRDLHALARSNSRLRRGMATLIIGAVALAFAGFANVNANNTTQRGSKEVSTERLVIKGSDGQPRIMMQGVDEGSLLVLFGPDKYSDSGGGGGDGGVGGTQGVGGFMSLKPRVRLQVTDEFARMQMLDPEGRDRIVVQLDANGPSFTTFDEDGNPIESP